MTTYKDMEMRTNAATFVEYRAGRGGGAGRLIGRTVPYNKTSLDIGGFTEVFLPGSFQTVLREQRDDVVADFNHNPDHVLARVSAGTLRLEDGPKGLDYVISPVPDTTIANDVVENVKLGNIQGNSFTFAVADGGDTWTKDSNGLPLRTVHEASRLWTVGPVVTPAYPDGTTISARSLALAERVSRGARLGTVLTSLIDDQVTEDFDTADVMSEAATVAGIRFTTLVDILRAELGCPSLEQLRGLAGYFGVPLARLREAAEGDGCEYGDRGLDMAAETRRVRLAQARLEARYDEDDEY